MTAKSSWPLAPAGQRRDLGDDGEAEGRLGVVLAPDAGLEAVGGDGPADAEEQPEGAEQQGPLRLGVGQGDAAGGDLVGGIPLDHLERRRRHALGLEER